jgi:cellulose synthase/poly-beta-1,6-N-acetylglucosamine synthase-like glycosyltransferase
VTVLVVFWLAASTIGYTLVVFPLMVLARGRIAPRPHRESDITPPLTVVIAAHNEEVDLPPKLANVMSVDYPADRLQVIVASDGSTDRTVELARSVVGERATVLDLPRSGKAGALNAALEMATGDVVVFTDANSMMTPQALRALVRPFADPDVGGVAGNQVYTESDKGALAGELAHWNFDRAMKTAATRAGSVVSATGALYAVRRELVQPVIVGVTDDFYVSTGVIASGRRLVFAPDAVVHEPVTSSTSEEFARKRRVMTRGFRSVLARRELLNPCRFGWDSVQLFTYKVLRRLLAVPIVALGVASVALRRRHRAYAVAAAAQVAFWVAAAVGYAGRTSRIGTHRIFAMPMFVAMGLVASVRAAADVVLGREIRQWTPGRATPADAGTDERAGV